MIAAAPRTAMGLSERALGRNIFKVRHSLSENHVLPASRFFDQQPRKNLGMGLGAQGRETNHNRHTG